VGRDAGRGGRAARATVGDRHRDAARVCARARKRHEEALRDAQLRRRRDEAVEVLAALAQDAAPAAEAEAALDADNRASRCDGLSTILTESTTAAGLSAARLAEAMAEVTGRDIDGLEPPGDLDADALAEHEQRTRSRVARIEALLPRERELERARAAVEEARAELAATGSESARVEERAESMPGELAAARAEAAAVGALAAKAEVLSLELQEATSRLRAAQEAQRCETRLQELLDAERAARDRSLDARERVQDLTARRLAGIAAELAGQLSAGAACQVCGSTTHPDPAAATRDHVTEREQAQAEATYDAAAVEHTKAAGEVVRARERLSGLRTAAGDTSVEAVTAVVADLEERLAAATTASVALQAADAVVARLEVEQRDLTDTLQALALRTAGLAQSVGTHERSIAQLTAELAEQVAVDVPLSTQAERLTTLADAYSRAHQARCDHDEALARVRDLTERTEGAARQQGFEDADALADARLALGERERLEALLAERARSEARARAVLEDDALRALEGRATLDPAPLADALVEAERHESDTARLLHQAEETVAALRRQHDRLAEALAAWAPLREEYLRADAMSRLVRGTGQDNQLQMRLSSYVLATRLDQVVAAANERLGLMRDQRYLLQRTDRAARKGAQAGLGLEVVDQWTGDVRDPGTLSGGETFVVSLSLALGLADVVTQEAGGTEIETLFVDEGFGTLDADTLDDVMDRLDELRAGGRAVGVVSHVSELRNRIPTQLHVEKLRHGSTVTVRTAVG
jgi:exonuclease SbcC